MGFYSDRFAVTIFSSIRTLRREGDGIVSDLWKCIIEDLSCLTVEGFCTRSISGLDRPEVFSILRIREIGHSAELKIFTDISRGLLTRDDSSWIYDNELEILLECTSLIGLNLECDIVGSLICIELAFDHGSPIVFEGISISEVPLCLLDRSIADRSRCCGIEDNSDLPESRIDFELGEGAHIDSIDEERDLSEFWLDLDILRDAQREDIRIPTVIATS